MRAINVYNVYGQCVCDTHVLCVQCMCATGMCNVYVMYMCAMHVCNTYVQNVCNVYVQSVWEPVFPHIPIVSSVGLLSVQ